MEKSLFNKNKKRISHAKNLRLLSNTSQDCELVAQLLMKKSNPVPPPPPPKTIITVPSEEKLYMKATVSSSKKTVSSSKKTVSSPKKTVSSSKVTIGTNTEPFLYEAQTQTRKICMNLKSTKRTRIHMTNIHTPKCSDGLPKIMKPGVYLKRKKYTKVNKNDKKTPKVGTKYRRVRRLISESEEEADTQLPYLSKRTSDESSVAKAISESNGSSVSSISNDTDLDLAGNATDCSCGQRKDLNNLDENLVPCQDARTKQTIPEYPDRASNKGLPTAIGNNVCTNEISRVKKPSRSFCDTVFSMELTSSKEIAPGQPIITEGMLLQNECKSKNEIEIITIDSDDDNNAASDDDVIFLECIKKANNVIPSSVNPVRPALRNDREDKNNVKDLARQIMDALASSDKAKTRKLIDRIDLLTTPSLTIDQDFVGKSIPNELGKDENSCKMSK